VRENEFFWLCLSKRGCEHVRVFVIATRNAHKVSEIQSIIGREHECIGLDTFPTAPPVVEDAATFQGNATRKAVQIARWLAALPKTQLRLAGLNGSHSVLADDSGLEVDALGGAPGVHSARFAALDTMQEGNSTDAENRAKLLRVLEGVPLEKRTARFRCVIALTPIPTASQETASPVCYADEAELQTRLFEGACEGHILFGERGSGGFGYDSLFVPNGYNETFAELSEPVKNQNSHRANALRKLRAALSAVS
jgi:XTP/dITP diphosphohydrolase